jgi:acetyl-CoA carboxylase biotin carboxyl carrier protein
MDIQNIKELIKAVSESDLTSFQYREGNIEILLGKEDEKIEPKQVAVEAPIVKEPEVPEVQETEDRVTTGNEIKTPLVGTVYLAPSEGAAPFVKVGDRVKKGQVVAIVEAMKLMNEIESDFDGVVKEVLVENGQMVEYGQPLFLV